jgi:hypothetical protein
MEMFDLVFCPEVYFRVLPTRGKARDVSLQGTSGQNALIENRRRMVDRQVAWGNRLLRVGRWLKCL